MKFLHMADTHLGKREYDIEERYEDFFDAFRSAIDSGIENAVEAILIAGDLFDRADVKPSAYIETVKIISRAKEHHIPVVVVEGNHDVEFHSDAPDSWLEVLSIEGHVILLRSCYEQNVYKLVQWEPGSRCGAYIDIGNLRIVGISYSDLKQPYSTRFEKLRQAIKELPEAENKFVVLMLHTQFLEAPPNGDESAFDEVLNSSNTKVLVAHIQYIALGHTHKQQVVNNWAYNPGSIEICRASEYHEKHGWFIVNIEADGNKKVTYHEYRSRPFVSITINVEGIGTYEEFLDALREKVNTDFAFWKKHSGRDAGIPVVELMLVGKPDFSLSSLDIPGIKELVHTEIHCIGVIIRTRQLSPQWESISDSSIDALSVIEMEELMRVFAADKQFGQFANSLRDFMEKLRPQVGEITIEALTSLFSKSVDTILE